MLPQFYNVEVIRNDKYKKDIFLIELDVKDKFTFKAGQFILVYQQINGKEENRAFSICSKPSQKTVELLIKRFENGKLSPQLSELKKGDKLKIRGPFGIFYVKTPLKREALFLAGGTGIAPLRSMIYEILENSPQERVTLIFGFREEEDFLFGKELLELQEKYPNFKLYPCSTKPKESWPYFKGRITDLLPHLIKSPDEKNVYLCGPHAMINDTLNLLIKNINFKKEQVSIERWNTK